MSEEFFKNKKPLLAFSDFENRATIADSDSSDQSFDHQEKRLKEKKRNLKQKKQNRKGLIINNGKIVLHISGYSGLKTFSISELVNFIPVHNLKVAGEKLLRFKKEKPNKKNKKIKQPLPI